MSFAHLHWYAPTLEKQVATSVLLPDTGTGPFPVFYLLHGITDDHTIWHRRSRIEHYVADLPLIVVMPDGFRGFYTNNHRRGPAYANYIARDLIAQIDRTFPTIRSRAGRAIGGLSMGGYGALRLSLGFPDTFCSANSHSGCLYVGQRPFSIPVPELPDIFGKNPRDTDHDLLHLAGKLLQSKSPRPEILLDCGRDDFYFPDNQDFHAALDRLGLPHTYREHPGGHTWDYWDRHIRDALKFHARNLGIHPTTPA